MDVGGWSVVHLGHHTKIGKIRVFVFRLIFCNNQLSISCIGNACTVRQIFHFCFVWDVTGWINSYPLFYDTKSVTGTVFIIFPTTKSVTGTVFTIFPTIRLA